jgi:hypothetical protein
LGGFCASKFIATNKTKMESKDFFIQLQFNDERALLKVTKYLF